MKTIKITEETHKELQKIKAFYDYKTLSQTIQVCINTLYSEDDRLEKEYDKSKK